MPWCFILAYLTSCIGRKKTLIITSVNQIIVAVSLYLTVTPTHLLITEALHGLTHASSMTTCIIAIAEYVNPRNRGVMMTVKSANVVWAILAANAIGTYAHWRYITILSFASSIYSLNIFFCPESPTWLASRGQYEESRKAHRWLRGSSASAEEELELMINSQMEERKTRRKRTFGNSFSFFVKKQFYYPVILSTLMSAIYQLSGKQVITMYAIEILKKITSSESTAYKAMLILDAVSVAAMYIGCVISKFLKRRFLLFAFGSCAVLFLLILSLYLYLVHLSYFAEDKYISVFLLVGFSVTIGLGPLILVTTIYGELVCHKYKGQSTVTIACFFVVLQSILLKNSPSMFQYFEMHGMFLFYAVSVSVCLIILYKYLPETKDKNLQEIETYFKE